MQKDTSGQRNATPRGNRPYDVSHSFVRKVATRVSGLFGGLFSTPDRDDSDSVESRLSPPDNEPSDPQLCVNNSVNPVASPAPYEAFRNHLSIHRLSEPVAGTSGGTQQAFVRHDNATHLDENPLLTPGPSGIKRRLGEATDQSRLRLDEAVRAGPSGISSKHSYAKDEERLTGSRGSKFPRYEPVEKTNLGDDHSESSESTSGCSSLVPQADRLSQSALGVSSRRKPMALDEKLNYARQLKQSRTSLYLNRSIPIHAETPRPSRTPSFDISAYGKPILNKSVRENMLSSPFYTGQTTYGGASATRRCGLPAQPSPRNIGSQIAVKPANEGREGPNMSQTARRILSALEELSTPLNDAKRIPTPVPPFAAKRRHIEVHAAGSPVKRPALEVPTVADMLKLKRLEEVQDSTTMARKVTVAAREPSPPRWSGKIVTKQKDRGKPVSDPAPPPSELPQVPLQLTSLPKFDLPPAVITPKVTSKPSDTAPAPAAPTKPEYSFASPTDMPPDWKTKHSSLDVDFDFSTPPKLTEYEKPKTIATLTSDAFSKLKRKSVGKIETTPASPVKELATGSVMDILSKPALVEKLIESNGPKAASVGFGDKFKQAAGSWSCSTCLVNNLGTADKCIACETPKVGEAKPKDVAPAPISSWGFGDKFKPAAGSWSCDSCMVNNTADAKKCVSCETVKPGSEAPAQKLDGFGDKFKPASGSWACDSCMVNNAASATKCIACESMKPGAATSNGPKTKEALQPNGPLSTATLPSFCLTPPNCTFKFGIDKADSGESVVNGPKKEVNQPFSVTTSSGTFSFGIPATQETTKKTSVSVSDEPDTSAAKSLEISAPRIVSESEVSKPQFSFGISTSSVAPSLPIKPAFTASPAQPFSLNGPAFSSAPTEIKSFTIPVTAAPPAFSVSTSFTRNSATVGETQPQKPANAPFSFGANKAAPSNIFKFGKTADDNKPSEIFRFGASTNLLSQPKTSEAGPAFPAFSSVFPVAENATQHVAPAPALFGFENSAPADAGFGQGAAAPPMAFGTPSVKFSFGAPSPAPTFNTTTTGFGSPAINTPFAVTAPTPAFGAQTAASFSGFGSNASNPFGAANVPAFGVPAATVAPFAAPISANTPNFGAPAQTAFGQTSAPAFPAAASSPFQFSAGNASAPPSGPSISLSMPPTFQFNMGQAPAPERRPMIRAKRRSQK